jgi:phosphoribosylformylglycinamidine cyclo-ligase
VGAWAELERPTWSPPAVFRVLADLGGLPLAGTEGTWNLGIGMLAVVDGSSTDAVLAALARQGVTAWHVGDVSTAPRPTGAFVQGAKGVDGGAVRLTGVYPF